MIETFDKTEHQREYEIDCVNLVKTIQGYVGANLNVNPETVAAATRACELLIQMNMSEGKRRGKEELLKELAQATAEVEEKISEPTVRGIAGFGPIDNSTRINFEKGFKLLKTILTGE